MRFNILILAAFIAACSSDHPQKKANQKLEFDLLLDSLTSLYPKYESNGLARLKIGESLSSMIEKNKLNEHLGQIPMKLTVIYYNEVSFTPIPEYNGVNNLSKDLNYMVFCNLPDSQILKLSIDSIYLLDFKRTNLSKDNRRVIRDVTLIKKTNKPVKFDLGFIDAEIEGIKSSK